MAKYPRYVPKTVRRLPQEIIPGLHADMGHYSSSSKEDFLFTNMSRKLNLFRPGSVNLAPQRYIKRSES